MTIVRPAVRPDASVVLLLILTAIIARAIPFGNPIVHSDEEFYFTAARAWLGGALPYVDVWDRKPIGLFVLYLPAASLGYPAGIWAYQAMALACAVATAWIGVLLARAGDWRAAAPLAGVAYLLWLDLLEGQGGQSPVFYDLPMALAAWLLASERAGRRANGLAALTLVGVALSIKTSAVFEGLYFGLWAMARFRREGNGRTTTSLHGAAMTVLAALPTVAAAASYWRIGALDAWTFANVTSIFQRRAEPFLTAAGNLAAMALLLSPLLAMAVVAWREHRRRRTTAQIFLFGWLTVAGAGVLAFGSWFDHYALPILLPASVCAAGAVSRPAVRRWVVVTLVLVAIGGQALLLAKRWGRGTPMQFTALVQAVDVPPPGCLYVYSGSTMLYDASGRCRPTRWIFPSHLSRDREEGAIGVDQAGEVRRILATRPAVIVLRDRPYRGERLSIRAILIDALARDYRRMTVLPLGREHVAVFASTSPR